MFYSGGAVGPFRKTFPAAPSTHGKAIAPLRSPGNKAGSSLSSSSSEDPTLERLRRGASVARASDHS